VQLAVLSEVEQDPQSRLVAQELEDLGQLAIACSETSGIASTAFPLVSLGRFRVLRAIGYHLC